MFLLPHISSTALQTLRASPRISAFVLCVATLPVLPDVYHVTTVSVQTVLTNTLLSRYTILEYLFHLTMRQPKYQSHSCDISNGNLHYTAHTSRKIWGAKCFLHVAFRTFRRSLTVSMLSCHCYHECATQLTYYSKSGQRKFKLQERRVRL